MCKPNVIAAFVSKHFLPIGTICIIPLGILSPTPAVYLDGKLPVVQICIVTLFFVIGTKFRLTEIQSALRCYKETALGIIVVLLLTPVVGTKLLMLPKFRKVPRSALDAENRTLNNSWTIELPDFGPEEFRIGLQIFCVSPCASAFPTVVVSNKILHVYKLNAAVHGLSLSALKLLNPLLPYSSAKINKCCLIDSNEAVELREFIIGIIIIVKNVKNVLKICLSFRHVYDFNTD